MLAIGVVVRELATARRGGAGKEREQRVERRVADPEDQPEVTIVRHEDVAAAPPGTYAVDVTSNANGTVIGTVNGLAASGTGGVMVVTAPGAFAGFTLQVEPGVTGDLGAVTVSHGLYGNLSSVVNSALASGAGGVVGEIGSLNTSISSMNQQITALQKEAAQETQELTAQYTVAQATLSQLTTVSNFLSTYFAGASGTGGTL